MVTKTEDWYVRTLDLVKQRHGGKLDRMGRPYHQHFERVADHLLQDVPEASRAQVQAALLHDAFEPGELQVSADELRHDGIDEDAVRIIERITLPTDGRSYLQYIADLATSRDVAAIQVKLADNADAIANHTADGSEESKRTLEQTYLPSRQTLLRALD
jgi:(p)ppGpp synthase/HD superfamily hydrolase